MPCSRKNIDAWRPQKRSAIFAIAALSACSNRYVFYIRAVSARADALLSQKYRRLAPTKTFSYFRDSGVINQPSSTRRLMLPVESKVRPRSRINLPKRVNVWHN
jgi:hypothetical protein